MYVLSIVAAIFSPIEVVTKHFDGACLGRKQSKISEMFWILPNLSNMRKKKIFASGYPLGLLLSVSSLGLLLLLLPPTFFCLSSIYPLDFQILLECFVQTRWAGKDILVFFSFRSPEGLCHDKPRLFHPSSIKYFPIIFQQCPILCCWFLFRRVILVFVAPIFILTLMLFQRETVEHLIAPLFCEVHTIFFLMPWPVKIQIKKDIKDPPFKIQTGKLLGHATPTSYSYYWELIVPKKTGYIKIVFLAGGSKISFLTKMWLELSLVWRVGSESALARIEVFLFFCSSSASSFSSRSRQGPEVWCAKERIYLCSCLLLLPALGRG